MDRVSLSVLEGVDGRIKGVQPVALALSPDARTLYVAEAGVNAVAVVRVSGGERKVLGHIPVGWWPSSVQVSPDGTTLFVVPARRRRQRRHERRLHPVRLAQGHHAGADRLHLHGVRDARRTSTWSTAEPVRARS